jgi:DNA-binding LytR/AlgR family response regulator
MPVPYFRTQRPGLALSLPFAKGQRIISIRYIVRLESNQNYTYCHFSYGSSLLVALTLKVLLSRLPPDALIRVHRKHAVNPCFVTEWNSLGSFVRLQTGEQLTIARRRNGATMFRKFAMINQA